MKPSLLLIAAGLAGFIGLFLPMVEVTRGPFRVSLSAKQLSFGLDTAHRWLDTVEEARDTANRFKIAKRATERLLAGEEDVRLVADASRGAALAYAPAALLFIVGAVGALRKRVGRIAGALAVLLGLGSIGSWIGLRFVLRYALDDMALEHTSVAMQIGAHLLLAVGALGVLGGGLAVLGHGVSSSPRNA